MVEEDVGKVGVGGWNRVLGWIKDIGGVGEVGEGEDLKWCGERSGYGLDWGGGQDV